MKREVQKPRARRPTTGDWALGIILIVAVTVLGGTIIATKAPCSLRPAWRPECSSGG